MVGRGFSGNGAERTDPALPEDNRGAEAGEAVLTDPKEPAHVWLDTGSVRLHAVQAGPEDGPLVILLHGFPEFWKTWKEQIFALSNAGYRVIAPDQRGYNLSEKPGGLESYGVGRLAGDVVDLIRILGRDKASIVGHDWGAVVGWCVGSLHESFVEKLVLMNGPHPLVMKRFLETSWDQRRRSWYILFFQVPWLPEFTARLLNWKILTRVLLSSSRKGAFSEEDLDDYREAWSQPRSFHCMLNWYRALRILRRRRSGEVPARRIRVPTLLLWGMKDRFLSSEMAQPSIEFCEQGRLLLLPEATHWVHREDAAALSEVLLDFLGDREPFAGPAERKAPGE